MLRLPIVPISNRFREAIMLPWQPPPPPQPVPQPSPWPLVGMFGLGLTIGLAFGAAWSAERVREQLRQMGGRLGTSTGDLISPIRRRAGLGAGDAAQPELVPTVPPGPSEIPGS